ncbi:tetratricopeptide repeat protein [Candidatus Electronema sp. JM]|uniref:tetratricopeptide repeat protein n=1 Tax=Candidatus Electronema sp. JM TaxID=3401571 RepID=UPI003AA9135A
MEQPVPIKIIQEAPSTPHRSNLPSQQFFFGRTKELDKIAEAISPEARTWGALIDGPGGIGKTALAIKAGHDAPAAHFERKIFLSAKVRELTPAGEQPLDDFTSRDYQTLLADLARELDADNAAQAAPDERVKAVHHALTGQRILLVIDNVETFAEAERVRLYQFFSRLPAGCKAVITSRRRTDIDARVIRLDRLEQQDAFALLDELAKDNPHLSKATAQEHCDLYEITGGNPLLLRWTAGQLGRTGSRCRTVAEACALLVEATSKGNDPLEYIFGDLVDTFTESETAVLAALALFSQPAPVEQIAAVAGIAAQAARTALDDLNSRALLVADEEGEKFLLPKLAATFIRRKRPEHVAASRERLTDRAYALALENGFQKYECFPILESEWSLLADSLPLFAQGKNELLQNMCDALATFLNFSGRWLEQLTFCKQAEEKALAAGSRYTAGWRAHQMGWIYYWRKQSDDVLACAARCIEYWGKDRTSELAAAIQLRGVGRQLEKNYPKAIECYQEMLAIWRTIEPESENVATGLNDLAEIKKLLGDFQAAKLDYLEALRIAKKINDREGIAIYTGNLAELLLLDVKALTQAEELARQALEQAEKVGRQELIASNSLRIAKALTQHGKAAEGLDYARRAVDIFTHLRQPDELEKAQAALRECVG